VVLGTLGASAGDSLKEIWRVHPSERIVEPTDWGLAKGHPVWDVAFSPDGMRLAVTMDSHYKAGDRTHLLILNVRNPRGPFRQFDLETCGNFLAWASDGNAILVCGMVVRLDNGSSCDLRRTDLERTSAFVANTSYWLDAKRVIRSDRTVTNLSCSAEGQWQIQGKWGVAGTEPNKGWILLQQTAMHTIDAKTLPMAITRLQVGILIRWLQTFSCRTIGAAMCSSCRVPRQLARS
jgi:hypothetical protein